MTDSRLTSNQSDDTQARIQAAFDAGYAQGVADGFKQGAGACASKCSQIAVDGLPQPEVDGQ